MALRTPRDSADIRRAAGVAARGRTPLASHAGWAAADDRPDPVELLVEQNAAREPDLVPVRHGRMSVSPFTFYRGSARIMASDLSRTPTAGLDVQLCGDAHLSNFGGYGSPERALVFDLNDFDETLRGPFEYDVKRLAASFVIAARNNGFTREQGAEAAAAAVAAYRTSMTEFAQMGTMQLWYAHMTEADLLATVDSLTEQPAKGGSGGGAAGKSVKAAKNAATSKGGKSEKKSAPAAKSAKKAPAVESDVARAKRVAHRVLEKAHTRDSLQALSKLGEVVDGEYRLISTPPVVVPTREWDALYGASHDQIEQFIESQFRAYRATLQRDRQYLLEKFRLVDAARKVVGVGSVGTRAFIALLQGDGGDPLFLQMKEATRSVLEDYLPRSRLRNSGARVVHGQRMMQATSDMFLGWTSGRDGRTFYWRQLRDMKVSAEVETMTPLGLALYGQLCGRTLARAHARSGDAVALAGYLGEKKDFDRAIAAFAQEYADQNEQDYAVFMAAIHAGRIEAQTGV